jgi:hypothetical protein
LWLRQFKIGGKNLRGYVEADLEEGPHAAGLL